MELIMRLLLAFVLLLFGLVPSHAATGLSSPVMTNFYQPHFIVVPNAPPTQVIKSRIFGPSTNIFNLTTNIYNDSYTTYSNSYIVYTNATIIGGGSTVIFTNSTIIYTNSTIIINGQTNDLTQLWRTNASGLYFPAITNTATIVVGQSAQAWWVPTLTDGFVSVHDSSAGDSQFNSLVIAAIDNVTQENYGMLNTLLGSGVAPFGNLLLLSATNWQNPAAPISKFQADLQPAFGEVLLDLVNNGIHEFSVSNQITSVQALQLTPLTNIALALGVNQVNVQSNSYIALSAVNSDPTTTEAQLSTGLRDGMLLLLQNLGVLSGFTLYNGSALYDDSTKFVTLSGGNWATTNYGDGIILIGGLNGWSEVGRFTQNTNVVTGAQLWELVSGHMRTVPDTLDDWQFRYGGVPQLTILTNGTINNAGFDIQNDGYLHVHGTDAFSELQLDGASAGSMIDIYNDDSLSLIQFQSPLNGIMRTAFISPTQTEGSPGINAPYWFGTIETYTNSAIWAIFNGTNAIVNNIPSISLGPDARITFGAKSPLLYSTNTLSGWIESDSVGSVSLGFLANTNMVASSANVAIGVGALNANLVGANNTAVGYHSLYSLTNTSGNTAIGEVAGRFLTNGTDNVLIGRLAGDQLKIGNQNVYIGSLAASAGTVGRTNAIVIGYNADSMGGNTANIGDSSVTVMFLGGEVGWYKGTGDPNGDASLDSAPLGSFYSNKSGGAGTSLYVKQVAGAGGWVGK